MNLTTFITHKHTVRLTILLALNAMLFGATNAATASSAVLMAGLVLIIVTVYYVVFAALGITRLYGIRISAHSRRRLAISLTGVIGLLVALQSIGGMSGRDFLVLVPLAGLGYMYSAYAKTSKRDLQT